MNQKTFSVSIILFVSFVLTSCAPIKKSAELSPDMEEFYSKVRYIMTQEESKIFLELPPSARDEFVEKFWGRRDPTPETERNEFKEVYFQRIEQANRLFRGGGKPGWLSERGRIYILFGPPDERQTNPMGGRPIDAYVDPKTMLQGKRVQASEKPTEIWVYYNLFSSMQKPHMVRLVFVDSHGTGNYELTTNLDKVLPGTMGVETEFRPNLALTHELHKEESKRATRFLQRAIFDFSWEFIKEEDKENQSNVRLRISIPYKKIIFTKRGEKRYVTDFGLEVKVRNANEEVVWETQKEYNLNFSLNFLEENKEGEWEEVIPFSWLDKGKYSVYIQLKNQSGDQEREKLLPLKM